MPDTRPANPVIVVAMHGCGGSGPGFYSGSEFASLANRRGFIVSYPSEQQVNGGSNCFANTAHFPPGISKCTVEA